MMDLIEAARATGGTAAGERAAFSGVSTDSRVIEPGDLFVALRGANFDGHDYVPQAIGRGAAAALVSRRVGSEREIPQVLVKDTKAALGQLAAAWRARFALPVVAITGSNGKTTVKDMLASVLAAHCGGRDDVLATAGNLNNDIGLPLMLLRLRERHRYAALEMGMNHPGEIEYLSRLASPGVALVNNAHRAHIGLLGSVEAIARAKGEIYAGLRPGGMALVNADDAFAGYWKGLAAGRSVVTFGTAGDADVRGHVEEGQLRLVTPLDAFAVTLQVPGEHNARNAIAACAAAFALEIPPRAIQAGLAAYAGTKGRLQARRGAGGSTVIDDTYNANPDSMKAAIRVLAAAPGRRVLVMGDMGELGGEEAALHAEVGAFARAAGIERLLALGPLSAHAAKAFGAGATHFPAIEGLLSEARVESAKKNVTLLVKGSRFMRMERVVERLAAEGPDAA
ncbi:MAG: UDP-N-acetylmuramoyl-tripeptide--D-alanyl-D-alanine ligase [Betaproteobacteria bacterium]|nr:UDP-N-acetylmuramoyl-tripeptide--D-alanyl-D-alanine ligase [Betaproteobacteria bacterium]PWB57444.1 MAG: UDP-N-acetylmuramoyl-tripeptide--D-alanyl-D-alanine ligase [Betaproteobacteria bacterium]